jgi:polyhydroxybutyrate depolymerase
VAGIDTLPRCPRSRPVPVITFHGTADPLSHYDGTPSSVTQNLPAPNGSTETLGQEAAHLGGRDPLTLNLDLLAPGPSIPQETASWATRNGCSTKVTTATIAHQVSLLSWSCPRHADVELVRIQGGGHSWPGSQTSAALSSVIGPTTFAISADAEMWSFFRAHPLSSAD